MSSLRIPHINSIFVFFLYNFHFQYRSVTCQTNAPLNTFNFQIADASVWFSASTYCPKESYPNLKFSGPAESFIFSDLIFDNRTDIEGYLGFQPQTNRIWVIYRGSSSLKNWIDDAEFVLVKAGIESCPNCKVHDGFKACNDATIHSVTESVNKLKSQYPDSQVVVTGHSLGGAVATLAAISLIAGGIDVIHYSCGSPRVGNADFAAFVNKSFRSLPQRLTHYKDVIPHTPYESLGFVHITSEIYEAEDHVLHSCDGPGDKSCAEQFSFVQTNANDHMLYLNRSMHCTVL